MDYWQALDQLVRSSDIIIDRPAKSSHPKFENIVYPFDYGYLDGSTGGDGEGVDVWVSGRENRVTGVVTTVDLFKTDAEVKLLLGFTESEMIDIEAFHNVNQQYATLLIRPGR
jgi:inorganic pyrophosphatase